MAKYAVKYRGVTRFVEADDHVKAKMDCANGFGLTLKDISLIKVRYVEQEKEVDYPSLFWMGVDALYLRKN